MSSCVLDRILIGLSLVAKSISRRRMLHIFIILSVLQASRVFALRNDCTRREMIRFGSGCILAQKLFFASAANAACLPGDASPDCIGVYKIPIDDNILPYTGTESALKKFAPDTRYVPPIKPPSSSKEALTNLAQQRIVADDVMKEVWAGHLEEAGVMTLKVLPQVTLAGRVLIAANVDTDPNDTIQSLRRQRLENQVEQVYVLWNSVDILIGQGMRGELGTIVVAQLAILDEIKDAIRALDDLISAVSQ